MLTVRHNGFYVPGQIAKLAWFCEGHLPRMEMPCKNFEDPLIPQHAQKFLPKSINMTKIQNIRHIKMSYTSAMHFWIHNHLYHEYLNRKNM